VFIDKGKEKHARRILRGVRAHSDQMGSSIKKKFRAWTTSWMQGDWAGNFICQTSLKVRGKRVTPETPVTRRRIITEEKEWRHGNSGRLRIPSSRPTFGLQRRGSAGPFGEGKRAF